MRLNPDDKEDMRIRLGLPNVRFQYPLAPGVGNCPGTHGVPPITNTMVVMGCHKRHATGMRTLS